MTVGNTILRNAVLPLGMVGMCVALLSIACLTATEIATARPQLVVPKTTMDLGQVAGGKVYRVPFEVRNSGLRRLVIKENDSCGCGASGTQTTIIPPSQTIELVVHLDTRIAHGQVVSVVSYTTSDPVTPRFNLIVKGSVEGEAMLPLVNQQQQVSILVQE